MTKLLCPSDDGVLKEKRRINSLVRQTDTDKQKTAHFMSQLTLEKEEGMAYFGAASGSGE